ncbi:sensor histidine kinase [Actinomadura scrupuli]|uniref:sensor histidine kinase n=1 Tax=Actinomadura scrupuli TaxID=559629 RepID=UPI003D95444A
MLSFFRSSLRARITLVAGIFAALFCIVVSVLVVIDVRDQDARYGQEQLTAATDRTHNHIRARSFPQPLASDGDEAIQILNPLGQVVTATRQLAGKPPMATFQPGDDGLRAKQRLCPPTGLEGCMTVMAYKVPQPDGLWMVYVAIPVVPWYANSTLAIFLTVMTLMIIAMMSIAVLRAVDRALAPVEAIRVEMDEIKATGLDRRVPEPDDQEEIKALATSVNSTLDRLEAAYAQLRRFTSDASHEVRSPVTAIRAQVEDALMYPEDTNWPEAGRAVLAATERMEALLTDLLLLARLDAGGALSRDPTDLSQVVETELDRRTGTVRVVRDLGAGVFAQCDRARITRLLANLIDNAEQHATAQITVTVRGDEHTAVIAVADDGAGIPADARETVFGRFTRLDTARDRDAGGTGLGLAIARQIAELHGGTLTVEDSERGALFVLRLPRCDPPGPPSAAGTDAHDRPDDRTG